MAGRSGPDGQEAHTMSEHIERLEHPIRYGPAAEPSLFALRGIRFFDGENGAGGGGDDGSGDGDNDGDEGNDDGQGAGGNSSGDGDRQQQQQRGNRSSGNRGAGRDGTFSREYVTELRTENSNRRRNEASLTTRAETAEREREEARAEAATLRRERAIERLAPKAGANPDALLDSAAFARETKDLDLADGEAVQKAIEAFVAKNPHVAAAPSGPGSSGSGRPGGSNGEQPKHENSLSGAVSAALAG